MGKSDTRMNSWRHENSNWLFSYDMVRHTTQQSLDKTRQVTKPMVEFNDVLPKIGEEIADLANLQFEFIPTKEKGGDDCLDVVGGREPNHNAYNAFRAAIEDPKVEEKTTEIESKPSLAPTNEIIKKDCPKEKNIGADEKVSNKKSCTLPIEKSSLKERSLDEKNMEKTKSTESAPNSEKPISNDILLTAQKHVSNGKSPTSSSKQSAHNEKRTDEKNMEKTKTTETAPTTKQSKPNTASLTVQDQVQNGECPSSSLKQSASNKKCTNEKKTEKWSEKVANIAKKPEVTKEEFPPLVAEKVMTAREQVPNCDSPSSSLKQSVSNKKCTDEKKTENLSQKVVSIAKKPEVQKKEFPPLVIEKTTLKDKCHDEKKMEKSKTTESAPKANKTIPNTILLTAPEQVSNGESFLKQSDSNAKCTNEKKMDLKKSEQIVSIEKKPEVLKEEFPPLVKATPKENCHDEKNPVVPRYKFRAPPPIKDSFTKKCTDRQVSDFVEHVFVKKVENVNKAKEVQKKTSIVSESENQDKTNVEESVVSQSPIEKEQIAEKPIQEEPINKEPIQKSKRAIEKERKAEEKRQRSIEKYRRRAAATAAAQAANLQKKAKLEEEELKKQQSQSTSSQTFDKIRNERLILSANDSTFIVVDTEMGTKQMVEKETLTEPDTSVEIPITDSIGQNFNILLKNHQEKESSVEENGKVEYMETDPETERFNETFGVYPKISMQHLFGHSETEPTLDFLKPLKPKKITVVPPESKKTFLILGNLLKEINPENIPVQSIKDKIKKHPKVDLIYQRTTRTMLILAEKCIRKDLTGEFEIIQQLGSCVENALDDEMDTGKILDTMLDKIEDEMGPYDKVGEAFCCGLRLMDLRIHHLKKPELSNDTSDELVKIYTNISDTLHKLFREMEVVYNLISAMLNKQ